MTRHIARKRFGQHFLSDGGIIDAIVDAISPQPGDAMVEIGPGLAALTQPLVERLGRLTVIELDRDLAQRLRGHGQLDVIESDVLKVDFAELAARLGRSASPDGPAKALRVVWAVVVAPLRAATISMPLPVVSAPRPPRLVTCTVVRPLALAPAPSSTRRSLTLALVPRAVPRRSVPPLPT